MLFLIVYSRIGHACRWHSDRSSCPLDKIKMPRWDIFVLSWLCYLCNLRAELLEIGREIDKVKDKLLN